MTYHLNRSGQDLGVCSLEQLKARRASGELNGSELVWTQGMKDWQPINSVLSPGSAPATPGIGPSQSKHTVLIVTLAVGFCLVVVVATAGLAYRMAIAMRPTVQQIVKQLPISVAGMATNDVSAMEAASRPVTPAPGTRTFTDVRAAGREFRIRQYMDGYKLRGERNPESDALALGFLSNWIEVNFGGGQDPNLPSISSLSDQLAGDTNCTDPLILTIAGVNAVQLNEGIRRLERAVKGFENSKHLGYPKFFATASLADKAVTDRENRLPALDAQALQYLHEALTDGSLQPGDQSEIAETLISGWGQRFFNRNEKAVYTTVQARGTNFAWLGLVLQGESEISEAWQARGGGFVNTVSDAGWEGFRSHLAIARNCLSQAWNLNPKWPQAPCRMIYVSLGDSNIGEMRAWFDRTVAAQLDYDGAWSNIRWGLRPRWYGDIDSMLAFGLTALNTKRFDTDVPRKFYDSVADVESEMKLPAGQHIYGRDDIWPHFVEMYNGYVGATNQTAWSRDGWRTAYSVIAFLAGKYDTSRQQLEPLSWKPHEAALKGYGRDLSIMALEVAARTGSKGGPVTTAENLRASNDAAGALKIYEGLLADSATDNLTRTFALDRQATLTVEKLLQAGEWAPFLPTDKSLAGWNVEIGQCKLLPDGSLEVHSGQHGHMLYSRVHVGLDFEVRGQFEVVNSTTKSFQGGLVMGMPDEDYYDWYGFRIKRNPDEGDVASFSQNYTRRQIVAPATVEDDVNTFDFTYHNGRFSATVNGVKVFRDVPPLKDAYVTPSEFLVGLGAFNNSNSTTLRYRNIEVRKLAAIPGLAIAEER
jgi:hypothetical protein